MKKKITEFTDEQLDTFRGDINSYYNGIKIDGWVAENPPEHFKTVLVNDGLMSAKDSLKWFFVNCLRCGQFDIYMRDI